MKTSLALALSEGLQSLSLELTQAQQQALLDYIALLGKWNKVYNLTAVREPEQMLSQHVLDCLAVLPPLKQVSPEALDLIDVGAGGGLPSVVFAIACPHWQITAVDTVAKKAAFIQTTAHSFRLVNLKAVHSRVEALTGGFDVVTCRAYASLRDFCDSSRHLLKPNGVWMAMKAKLSAEELTDLPATVRVDKVEPLAVPGLDADRCLVWMRPV
ncbi:MAG: 16S rRNA (guanine(527)-N(7))-methyltransferase RsmG [Burkholderiales bacterium]|nr:16S rRNA (guanine(527)-N(7))-methyltransferase RsmG [Burkholderiales bacterium]